MKTLIAILLIIIVQLAFAQADTSDASKIQAAKIKSKTICGRYIYQTSHGYTVLKIKHTKHFKKCGLLYFGWIISYGKWNIKNDTLQLIEKSFREKPLGKRKRDNADTTRLIFFNNALFGVYEADGKKIIDGKYITKRQ